MDIDPVPEGDSSASSSGTVRQVDAATRMAVRRHPAVLAAIVSGFAVRAMDIAAALEQGVYGNLDLPLVLALVRDLGQDLGRAREYAWVRHLTIDMANSPGAASVFSIDQAPLHVSALVKAPDRPQGRHRLVPYYYAALRLSHEFCAVIRVILHHGPGSSHDEDLRMARELAGVLCADLARLSLVDYFFGNYARDRTRLFDLAFERARSLDSICAMNLAGRLGISSAEGLPEAVTAGALDDFTDADLSCASLSAGELGGVRWSLSGTVWPHGTDVKALRARSEEAPPGSGVLVFKRRSTTWQPAWRPPQDPLNASHGNRF